MFNKSNLYLLALMVTALAGCGSVKPVTGGTSGTLSLGDQLLSEIQVTVHKVDGTSFRNVGFGVTDRDGWFELVTNRAQGPLVLEAREYRFTLESAGAPVQVPKEYSQAETTPLKVSWSGDGELELKVTSALPLQ